MKGAALILKSLQGLQRSTQLLLARAQQATVQCVARHAKEAAVAVPLQTGCSKGTQQCNQCGRACLLQTACQLLCIRVC